MVAGLTVVAAPQASAAVKCHDPHTEHVAHKAIKKGKTTIGYLDVYNTARDICVYVTAKSKTNTKGIGALMSDGLDNKHDQGKGSPEPTRTQWKNGWDAVDFSTKYRVSAGPAEDYDNGVVLAFGQIKKGGTWYSTYYQDSAGCGTYTWSELKETCV
jgi:hypothetical protein